MEKEEYESFNKIVEKAIKQQGRTKTWLAEALKISRPTLDRKLKNNTFKLEEVVKLKNLNVL
jgi:transcriptional regulator with PAS, ATPase and Fis domain